MQRKGILAIILLRLIHGENSKPVDAWMLAHAKVCACQRTAIKIFYFLFQLQFIMPNSFTSVVLAVLLALISISHAVEPSQLQPATPVAPSSGKPDSPKEVLIRVMVTGDVVKRGVQEFSAQDKTTVSKAIAAVGGFTDSAQQKRVKLVRKGADGRSETAIINVQDILKGVQGNDPVLQADDSIIVPTRFLVL